MPNENPANFAKPQVEEHEDASADTTRVILAEVLRVFAARGRALRAERTKREAGRVLPGSAPDISDKQEPKLNAPEGSDDL